MVGVLLEFLFEWICTFTVGCTKLALKWISKGFEAFPFARCRDVALRGISIVLEWILGVLMAFPYARVSDFVGSCATWILKMIFRAVANFPFARLRDYVFYSVSFVIRLISKAAGKSRALAAEEFCKRPSVEIFEVHHMPTSAPRKTVEFLETALETRKAEIYHPVATSDRNPYAPLIISLIICLVPQVILLLIQGFVSLFLHLLGFRVNGIARRSIATWFQSHIYGGITPPNSAFAKLQSARARYRFGTANDSVLVGIRVLVGTVAFYNLLGIILG